MSDCSLNRRGEGVSWLICMHNKFSIPLGVVCTRDINVYTGCPIDYMHYRQTSSGEFVCWRYHIATSFALQSSVYCNDHAVISSRRLIIVTVFMAWPEDTVSTDLYTYYLRPSTNVRPSKTVASRWSIVPNTRETPASLLYRTKCDSLVVCH